MEKIKDLFISLYNIYIVTIKNYFNFKGRCSRKNFWLFTLDSFIISMFLFLISKIINTNILTTIYSIFIIIPGLSIASRRFHDCGKSAKLFFITYFVPLILLLILYIALVANKTVNPILIYLIFVIQIIFYIYMLYILLKKGDKETNKYGELDI